MRFKPIAISLLIPLTPVLAQNPDTATPAQSTAANASTQPPAGSAGMFGAPPANQGQIIFYRPGGLLMAPGCMVREGEGSSEVRLSKLTQNRYFVHYADPGTHRYWAKNLSKDAVNLEIEAGETYFVRCEIAVGLMSGNPNLAPSNAAEFDSYKDKLKPMDKKGG